jgi:hypothetical protein
MLLPVVVLSLNKLSGRWQGSLLNLGLALQLLGILNEPFKGLRSANDVSFANGPIVDRTVFARPLAGPEPQQR